MALTTNPTMPTSEEAAPAQEALSPSQLRGLESLRDDLNRLYGSATQRLNEIADKVFDEIFDGDVAEGLSPNKSSSARYRVLMTMCGTSLLVDRVQLSRASRIGALNHHFAGRPWTRLPWSIKVELLPLLGNDGDVKRLSGAIAAAGKASATVTSIRQWVAEHLPDDEKSSRGKPKALSMTAASKILSGGRQLKLVTARRLVALRLRRMGNSAVNTAVADIDLTIKSLTQLREELTET